MKIALLSDTHDNYLDVDLLIAQVKARNIGVLVHCGDMVAPTFLKELISDLPEMKIYFVFGNNDGERVGLNKTALAAGERVICLGDQGIIEVRDLLEVGEDGEPLDSALAKKKIWLTHDSALAELVARSEQFDFCFGGHDHRARKVVYGKTIFVNPGNLTVKKAGEFYKSADHCWSVVDLESGEVEKIEVN